VTNPKRWRRLISWLRREFPARYPVTVASIPQVIAGPHKNDGASSLSRNRFLVEVRRRTVLRVAYRCAHARVGTLPDVARGRGGRGSQQRMGDCVRAHLPRILEMELGEIMASPGQPPKRKSLLRQAQSEPPTGRFAWFRSLSTELQGELLELKEAHQRGAMQHTVRGLWEIASRNGVKVSLEAFTHWMK